MENQKQNDKPWTENLMEMFGFGDNKGEAVVQSSAPITAIDKKPAWADPESLWAMWSPPKPPMVKKEVDSIFDKLIHAESRGNHYGKDGKLLESPVGALGITQVMPKSGKNPGYGVAPLKNDSEAEYVRFGKDLLRAYTRELGGDIRKGVAAYNHGIGNVQKKVAKYGNDWETKLPTETKKYLKNILGK